MKEYLPTGWLRTGILKEYISHSIYYSFYHSIISIYWSMSFTSYSKSYYWGNTWRMKKIGVNKNKTQRVTVFTYPNLYM